MAKTVSRRRYRKPWEITDGDQGFIRNNAGPRMMVYRPDFPGVYTHNGYAYRARVVWWLVNKRVPPKGYVVHHINENTLDDRPENLLLLSAKEHSRLHHEKAPPIILVCPVCTKEFSVQFNIISQHLREGRRFGQKFCSKKCRDTSMIGQRGFSRCGITPNKVKEIRKRKKEGARVVDLALIYKMSTSGIYAILRGDNWGDVK